MKPFLLELKINPLGFKMTAGGEVYWLPLSVATVQRLLLALLHAPGVDGVSLDEEKVRVMADVEQMAAETAAVDEAFLKAVGATASQGNHEA